MYTYLVALSSDRMVRCVLLRDFYPVKLWFSVCPMNLVVKQQVIEHLAVKISVSTIPFWCEIDPHASYYCNCLSFYLVVEIIVQ